MTPICEGFREVEEQCPRQAYTHSHSVLDTLYTVPHPNSCQLESLVCFGPTEICLICLLPWFFLLERKLCLFFNLVEWPSKVTLQLGQLRLGRAYLSVLFKYPDTCRFIYKYIWYIYIYDPFSYSDLNRFSLVMTWELVGKQKWLFFCFCFSHWDNLSKLV